MNNEETLRVIRKHALEAIFQVMRVVTNYRKGQKQFKKIAKHLKNTSARPPIYEREYPEKLSTASLSDSVGVTKPTSLLLFVQPDKNFWKTRQVSKTPMFRQFSAINR